MRSASGPRLSGQARRSAPGGRWSAWTGTGSISAELTGEVHRENVLGAAVFRYIDHSVPRANGSTPDASSQLRLRNNFELANVRARGVSHMRLRAKGDIDKRRTPHVNDEQAEETCSGDPIGNAHSHDCNSSGHIPAGKVLCATQRRPKGCRAGECPGARNLVY